MNNTAEWLSILAEEFGEVAQDATKCHFSEVHRENLEVELIQVAAVCVSWLEHIRGSHVSPRRKA